MLAQGYEWQPSDLPGSAFLKLIEIDGELFGAVGNGPLPFYYPEYKYQLTIYKIVPASDGVNFEMEEVKSFNSAEHYSTITIDYIKETSSWLFYQSAFVSSSKQLYRILLYDKYFNLLAEETLDTMGIPGSFHTDTNGDNTYMVGSILTPLGDKIMYFNYSHKYPDSLSHIQITQTFPNPTLLISSMTCDKRTGNLLIFNYDGLAAVDTNLIVSMFYGYNKIRTFRHGYMINIEDNYYSHGLAPQIINGPKINVVHKYDSLFNIIKADTFGILGKDNYPFLFKSLDYKNDNVVVGGHLEGLGSASDFSQIIKRFYLAKLDRGLNVKWYKQFGGDKAYVMLGVKMDENGGTFAYGYITDSISEIPNAYLMHVDSNGNNFISKVNDANTRASIRIVNPSFGTLTISNPTNIYCNIHIFDIKGHLVKTFKLDNNYLQCNVADLPVGEYFANFVKDNMLIECIKWLKLN